MTGLLLGWTVFATAQVMPPADRGELVAAVRKLDAAARELMSPQPEEACNLARAAGAAALRVRLAGLVNGYARYAGRESLRAAPDQCFAALQTFRDAIATGDALAPSPFARLRWRAAAWEVSRKTHALQAIHVRSGAAPPQLLDQAAAQVYQSEALTITARREAAESLGWPFR